MLGCVFIFYIYSLLGIHDLVVVAVEETLLVRDTRHVQVQRCRPVFGAFFCFKGQVKPTETGKDLEFLRKILSLAVDCMLLCREARADRKQLRRSSQIFASPSAATVFAC